MSDGPGSRPLFRLFRQYSWALLLAFLAVLGIALRWYRLDLTSFRFDAAEAMFRAREALQLGFPPLTGIENSLGFRNPAGLIWAILPTALVTPRVEPTTAWIGLLTISGLWPLYRISRALLHGMAWVIPCAAYAFMPAGIFMGRTVWAQNLMPALGAWALWLLVLARSSSVSPNRRAAAAAGALAVLGFATAVHLSGAAYLIAALVVLGGPIRHGHFPRRRLAGIAGALAVGALLLLPSFLDLRDSRLNPRPKAQHAAAFESLLPPPPSPLERIRATVSANIELVTQSHFGGIEELVSRSIRMTARAGDFLLLVLVLGGLGRLLLGISQRGLPPEQSSSDRPENPGFLLLAWIVIPAFLGGISMTWVNASYFAPSLPALLLLAGFAVTPGVANRFKWLGVVVPVAFFCLWVPFFFAAMKGVEDQGFANGPYYIPLRLQEQLARELKETGVSKGQFIHLSGEWYERPYQYLHEQVAGAKRRQRLRFTPLDHDIPQGDGEPYALVDDLLLRTDEPARARWLSTNMPHAVGTVRFRVFPDASAAGRARDEYFSLPR